MASLFDAAVGILERHENGSKWGTAGYLSEKPMPPLTDLGLAHLGVERVAAGTQ
jgi:hypothetical protein